MKLAWKIGLGFDLHRTVPDKPLLLGGVEVPAPFGLLAHSDGDVLLHALADAVFGAVGAGDIGEWFPDTDEAHRGMDSVEILRAALGEARKRGYILAQTDINILAETPKLKAHKKVIQLKLSELARIPADCVGVKAKTMEGLGPIGNREAIACQAVVLLRKLPAPPRKKRK